MRSLLLPFLQRETKPTLLESFLEIKIVAEQSEILIVVPTRNKKNVSKIFDGSITPRIASINLCDDESSESSGQTIFFPEMYANQKFVPKTFGHHNDYGDYEGFETQEIKISAGIYTFWIVCLNHCPDYYYSHEFEIKIDGVEYSVEL